MKAEELNKLSKEIYGVQKYSELMIERKNDILLRFIKDLQSQLKEERESLKIINTVMINKDYEGARKLLESIIYSNLKTK